MLITLLQIQIHLCNICIGAEYTIQCGIFFQNFLHGSLHIIYLIRINGFHNFNISVLPDIIHKSFYTILNTLCLLLCGKNRNLSHLSECTAKLISSHLSYLHIIGSPICLHQFLLGYIRIKCYNRNSIFLCSFKLCLTGIHVTCRNTKNIRILCDNSIYCIDLSLYILFIIRTFKRHGNLVIFFITICFINFLYRIFHAFLNHLPVFALDTFAYHCDP